VTAKDAFNNTATGYTGTVHFSSSDPMAVLPANYTFVGADNGVHNFAAGITLKTSGSRTVTATDTVTASINGSQTVTITAGAATSLTVSGLVSAPALTVQSVTVTAKDLYGNVATGYTGKVHFTSTDFIAVLPADYTFVAGDNGAHTFAGGYPEDCGLPDADCYRHCDGEHHRIPNGDSHLSSAWHRRLIRRDYRSYWVV
jgi:hypothetical protein